MQNALRRGAQAKGASSGGHKQKRRCVRGAQAKGAASGGHKQKALRQGGTSRRRCTRPLGPPPARIIAPHVHWLPTFAYIGPHWPQNEPIYYHCTLHLHRAFPSHQGVRGLVSTTLPIVLVLRYSMPESDPTTLHGIRGILVLENAPFTANSPRDLLTIPQAHGRAAPRRSRSSPPPTRY